MYSERDKQGARTIVSIFETGKKFGNPAAVAVLKDGAGISYGMHQATHKSGSLLAIVQEYCDRGGQLAAALSQFIPQLKLKDQASVDKLAANAKAKQLLADAGKEALMRGVQEDIFDKLYLNPAVAACDGSNFVEALSLAVIYDSHIQGGFAKVRDRVPAGLDERAWIARYVDEREKWLAGSAKPIVRKTVYRPQELRTLIAADNWSLATPFKVRGITIEESDLAQADAAP
jgi:hypothetical protein